MWETTPFTNEESAEKIDQLEDKPEEDEELEDNEASAKLRRYKEVDAYNRATVMEHELLKSEQSAKDIKQRKQTHLTNQERDTTEQDAADVEKHLRQTTLCSQLDSQVAEKLRVKGRDKKISDDFTETWIWGGSARSEVDQAAEKLRKYKEVDAYNRATVLERELARKQGKQALILEREQYEDKENKQRQIEAEREVQRFNQKLESEIDQAAEGAEKLKRGREVDAYNRATVMEHELSRKQEKQALILEREQYEDKENKRILIEEEREVQRFNQKLESEIDQAAEGAEKLKRGREVDAYNRATVLEHELSRKQEKQALILEREQYEDKENKRMLIEEEREVQRSNQKLESEIDQAAEGAEKLKRSREVDAYNRATVKEHELSRKQEKQALIFEREQYEDNVQRVESGQ
ncbi:hypothetical protein WDU94_010443 [Cyamophila willieti]